MSGTDLEALRAKAANLTRKHLEESERAALVVDETARSQLDKEVTRDFPYWTHVVERAVQARRRRVVGEVSFWSERDYAYRLKYAEEVRRRLGDPFKITFDVNDYPGRFLNPKSCYKFAVTW